MAKKKKKSKNIILLSDGTGNSAAKFWRTNVWRLYQALDLADGERQIALYDDGVGTSSFKPLAILGGALGFGLKRNVIDLYTFLCRHYDPGGRGKPGDQIYCFGFSRGAFTIRELVAFIAHEGLIHAEPRDDLRERAGRAYRSYRETYKKRTQVLVIAARSLRDVATREAPIGKRHRPKIHFLGLWDTVAAYGLPIEEMKRGIDLYFWPLSFPDRILNPAVERACHALSLDDERLTFHPVLWTEQFKDKTGRTQKERVFPETIRTRQRRKPITNIRQERISQVWFTGVHANVGGGYPDDSLAHVPLKWMMDEAADRGVIFKPDDHEELSAAASPLGRTYDSRHGLAGYYRYAPRKISLLTQDKTDETDQVIIDVPKIHESVFQRIKVSNQEYAPIVLPGRYAVVTEKGDIKFNTDNPYEDLDQSRDRELAQEKAWNWVWGRRISYFLTLLASFYLLAFPIFYEPWDEGACNGSFRCRRLFP